MQNPAGVDPGLQASAVIHAINGDFVLSVDALKSAVARLKTGDPVALLNERGGQLLYVTFENE
jgi:S1-C subfamily serine protease